MKVKMEKDWLDLEGKVVLVTGGEAGIGRHIASVISDCGAEVLICDCNVVDDSVLDGMTCVQCNVTKKESTEAMVHKVMQKYGKIDALVNNAGVTKPQLLVDLYGTNPEYEIDEASFDFMVNVNMKGELSAHRQL